MNSNKKEITLSLSDIKWLFNIINIYGKKINTYKLKFTSESKYSMTPWCEASIISREIINFFGTNMITVTDATANVGGNTIDFYNNKIDVVNSVEIDKETSDILKNNLLVYEYEVNNVYNKDYRNICMILSQHCIFFDPPWGGPEYIKKEKIDLFLEKTNVVDLIYKLLLYNKAELIVLKAPKNFNEEYLRTKLSMYNIEKKPMYRGKDKKHSYDVFYIHYKLYGELNNDGYCGIFRGKIYDSDGKILKESDIIDLDTDNKYKFEDVDLYPHLYKNWHKKIPVTSKYGFQAGIGGDEGTGLIDFYLGKPIKCPPDMKFMLYGKEYIIKFYFDC